MKNLFLAYMLLNPVHLIASGIIVIGDSGTARPEQFEVARSINLHCRFKKCDLGVIVGDLIYPNGIKRSSDKLMISNFEKPYKDIPFTFWPTLGNHDHRGSWRAMVKYKSPRWNMPSRYFYVDKLPDVDLYGLDTQYFHKEQQRWLEQSLAKSKKKWKIVYGHHPVFSSGMHGDGFLMKRYLLPILKKYKVDFYLAGHDHHLELIDKDGLVTVISGAAGKLRDVKKSSGSIFAKSEFGFVYLETRDDTAIIEFIDRSNQNMFYSYFKKGN